MSSHDDVCPVCKGMDPADAQAVVFVQPDGTEFIMAPQRESEDKLTCQMYQSINYVNVYVLLADGTHVNVPTRTKNTLAIGDELRITGRWNCRACAGDGKATTAMRRRIEGLWNP